MILDNALEFCDNYVLPTLTTGGVNATKVIDLVIAGLSGEGEDIEVVIQVGTGAFTTGVSLKADLVTSATNSVATTTLILDTSITTYPLMPVVLEAALTANTQIFRGKLPTQPGALLRYIQIAFTNGSGTHDAAASVTAFLVKNASGKTQYASTTPGIVVA